MRARAWASLERIDEQIDRGVRGSDARRVRLHELELALDDEAREAGRAAPREPAPSERVHGWAAERAWPRA